MKSTESLASLERRRLRQEEAGDKAQTSAAQRSQQTKRVQAERAHTERLARQAKHAREEDISNFEKFLFDSSLDNTNQVPMNESGLQSNLDQTNGGMQGGGMGSGLFNQQQNNQQNGQEGGSYGSPRFSAFAKAEKVSRVGQVALDHAQANPLMDENTVELKVESSDMGPLTLHCKRSGDGWVVQIDAQSIEKSNWLSSQRKIIERGLTRDLGVPITVTVGA